METGEEAFPFRQGKWREVRDFEFGGPEMDRDALEMECEVSEMTCDAPEMDAVNLYYL
jgi:hypothetical protein